MIEFGHGTHVGLRHARNEDTYCADAAAGLFLVADGMGGHTRGECAAALARDSIGMQVRATKPLSAAIRTAHHDITEQRKRSADTRPMGTTVAAVRLVGTRFEAAWVGDSRIYLMQGRTLQALSGNPSQWQEWVDAGVLDISAPDDDDDADEPPHNILTQALGVTRADALKIGSVRGNITADTRFLLCTDGLTEHVSDARLATIMARDELAAQELVDHLLLAALDAGGHDNVTAIVVRCRPG